MEQNLVLKKFDLKSEEQYQFFKKLMIGNLQYSIFSCFLPNVSLVDLCNKEVLTQIFNTPANDNAMRDIYIKSTIHNDKLNIGYYQVLENNQPIGLAGFMVEKLNQSNQILKCEGGIHLDANHRSETKDNKKHYGEKIKNLLTNKLVENEHELDKDAVMTIRILQSNTRSQSFFKKHNIVQSENLQPEGKLLKQDVSLQKCVKATKKASLAKL
jgi:hypothetical protein